MRLLAFILRLLTPWTWWNLSSEPVPAPVQMKSSETSKASTQNVEPSAPVPSGTTLSPAPVQQLRTRPPATEQAQALLELLHRDYAGFKVRAVDVERISYPQLVRAAGWRAQPWDGKNGVGAHFGRLTRRTFGWFEADSERKRQRAYAIPVAITVRKRA